MKNNRQKSEWHRRGTDTNREVWLNEKAEEDRVEDELYKQHKVEEDVWDLTKPDWRKRSTKNEKQSFFLVPE